MSYRLAWILVLAAGACGRADPNRNPDAYEPERDVAPEHDLSDDVQSPTTCSADLAGSSAFTEVLSGVGQFVPVYGSGSPSWPRERTVVADVYFPTGRVPGGSVILTMPDPVGATAVLVSTEVRLADDLSATGISVSGSDMHVTAELLPGAGGLRAVMHMNFAQPSTDVADDGTATVLLCPEGRTTPPSVEARPTVTPIDPIIVDSTVPLAATTLSSVTATVDDGALPVTAQFVLGRSSFTVTPVAAFPPNQKLVLDLSQVRDVIGRPLPAITGELRVMGTSAVLTDLTLSTPAPAGALACVGTCQSIAVGGGFSSGSGLNELLVGLPDPGAATKLRVRATMTGPYTGGTCTSPAVMAVIGQTGARSELVNLTCATDVDYDIDLQSVPPARWLVVRAPGAGYSPYSLPPPPSSQVVLQSLQFL